MQDLIIQFSFVVGLATFLGILLRFLKLPLIIAYLVSGLVLSAFRLTDPNLSETLKFLPEVGIAFLLFLVGLEMDFRGLKQLGRSIFVASIVQVCVTLLLGSLLLLGLGFKLAESIYLGLGLGFSSTILVVKFLTERKEILSLHGKLAVGILLVEDLIAIVTLMFLSIYNTQGSTFIFQWFPLFLIVLKGLALFYVLLFLSKRILPKVFSFVASNQELLFLASVAWCLLFASLAISLGFSLGIGAFLAGLALATSPYRYQIAGKMKPLRDLFIALFFIDLGASVSFLHVERILGSVTALSLFVLISKPVIFMAILGRLGYRRHTLVLASSTLTQISEFSLILVAAGFKLGHVSQEGVTAAALVGIVTMVVSTLFMAKRRDWYAFFGKVAAPFEMKQGNEDRERQDELTGHVILIGCHRMGRAILNLLKQRDKPYIVLDFNPEVMKRLTQEEIPITFGSLSDPEVLSKLKLANADLIISTITDLEDNLALLSEVKAVKAKAYILMAAQYPDEAYELYRAGAHFVILPYAEAGQHMVHLLDEHYNNLSYFDRHVDVRMREVLREQEV